MREADEGAGGDEDFFGETAIAIDAEKLAEEAEGFIAAPAKFAFATKKIGLDGDFIGGMPFLDVAANSEDAARNFAAECARQLDGNGQAGGFGPEIDVVKAAALDLDDNIIRAGDGIGDIAQFEFSRRAVGDKLDCFQASPKSKVQSPKSSWWTVFKMLPGHS